jgi:hypothetical protein
MEVLKMSFNKKSFNELPESIQEEIKNTLRVFDGCYVIYEYGKYNVTTGIALKKEYAADHEFIGEYKANEMYSNDERIVNYIEEFLSYPAQYKGKKDWKMIKELENLRKNMKHAKIKLVDGNAVIDSITDIEY